MEAIRRFRNKNKEYLKPKIDELETNSKIKNIIDLYRGINEFKKGYQPRIQYGIRRAIWLQTVSLFWLGEGMISQLFNVHGFSDVRQTEINTAEPLMSEPSDFGVEMAIEKLKRDISPGTDQNPAELIKTGCRTIRFEIRKLIISIWDKEELPEEWKKSVILPIYKKGIATDCNNYRGMSLLPTTYKILSNILLSTLTPYAEEIIGDHECGFRRNRSTTDHIFCIRHILEKKWE